MSDSAGAPDVPASAGLYTRQSSGLVRELGVTAATGIALASVALVNTFINFSNGLIAFDRPDMTLPLFLAAGIWLVGMFAYKYLLLAIPRAGGEYVYVSRVISPVVGRHRRHRHRRGVYVHPGCQRTVHRALHAVHADDLGDAFSSSWIAAGANHVTGKGAIARDLRRDAAHRRRAVAPAASARRPGDRRPRRDPAARVRGAGDHPAGPLAQRLREVVRRLQQQLERLQRDLLGGQVERHCDRREPHGVVARRAVHGAELQRRAVFVLRRRRAAAAGTDVRHRVDHLDRACS